MIIRDLETGKLGYGLEDRAYVWKDLPTTYRLFGVDTGIATTERTCVGVKSTGYLFFERASDLYDNLSGADKLRAIATTVKWWALASPMGAGQLVAGSAFQRAGIEALSSLLGRGATRIGQLLARLRPGLQPARLLVDASGRVFGFIGRNGRLYVTTGNDLAAALLREAGTAAAETAAAGTGNALPRGRWVPETTAGWSQRAIAYQEQITGRPTGTAYEVGGVRFDGIVNGVLVEAKGPGYAELFRQRWFRGWGKLVTQARNQLLAVPKGTSITWHVAEKEAADALRALFQRRGIDITVVFTPPVP